MHAIKQALTTLIHQIVYIYVAKDNLKSLMGARNELDAHYREPLPKRIKPTMRPLAKIGHHKLATIHGPLEIL